MSARRVVVAGCGYTGLVVARLLAARGWSVLGLAHSAESVARLAGENFPVAAADISSADSVAQLADWRGCDAVVHCASSSRGGVEQYQAVYARGAENLARVLKPGRLWFTSSTSVYPQIEGEIVTEESPAEPASETGRILREAENFVLSTGGGVARLAGIYGPGRSVLLRKFFAGESVLEAGGIRWVNQIHRDDAATALAFLVERETDGIFNVCDDAPLMQREIFDWLCARFARPLPPPGPIPTGRKRAWTSKRVSNAKLRALGWLPRYASMVDAVEVEGDRLWNVE